MTRAALIGLVVLGATCGAGCAADALDSTRQDMAPAQTDMPVMLASDQGVPADDGGPLLLNLCGDQDPRCWELGFDPARRPFPLPTDPRPDPAAAASGIRRDVDGSLVIDPSQASSPYVWLALSDDDTVAKLDARTMKEVARYRTVTCFSSPSGNKAACDGASGCCAADSQPQWTNRKAGMPDGPAQQVQITKNVPWRTAVDVNGDAFVATGSNSTQASVTKIANAPAACRDRNKNGRIDTSSDVDGDGRIDRNDPKEFLDLDDECILWTTNHGAIGSMGLGLDLGPGAGRADPLDAFAADYNGGIVYRIDGTTGKTKDQWQLPQGCSPGWVAIDPQGFGWTVNPALGPLCYFDTRGGASVGQVPGTMVAYGVTVDRDANIWVPGRTGRYTPDRSSGFASLGNGHWTWVGGGDTRALAADWRSADKYFVWAVMYDRVFRIPASEIPIKGDSTVPFDQRWPNINVPGGVGLDAAQNVVATSVFGDIVRTRVDANGDFAQPDLVSPPKGVQCPAGDRCDLGTKVRLAPEFTGVRLRNISPPVGAWSYIVRGCGEFGAHTHWFTLTWEADLPPKTWVAARARSGPTPKPDRQWGPWTAESRVAPFDLSPRGVLVPNAYFQNIDANYLQIEFTLGTNDRAPSPKLKAISVALKCIGPGPG